MLKKFGLLIVVLGLGVVGIAQEDGSAPYPIDEPSPQIGWRCCVTPVWQNTPWKVLFEGFMKLYTWRCHPLAGLYYVRLEEAEFCCYRGWKVFGVPVSQDAMPTCWFESRTTYHFIGCVPWETPLPG